MGCTASKSPAAPPPTKGWTLTPDVLPQYAEGKHWVSSTHAKRELVFAKDGPGSKEGNPPMTFSAMFKQAARTKADKPALRVELDAATGLPPALGEDGSVPAGLPLEEWKTWTWGEYYDESLAVAKGMLALGGKRFDGAVIYGLNSPQWLMSQMGAILAGVLPAGIYPTDTPDQIEYKTKYADAAFAMCGGREALPHVRGAYRAGAQAQGNRGVELCAGCRRADARGRERGQGDELGAAGQAGAG